MAQQTFKIIAWSLLASALTMSILYVSGGSISIWESVFLGVAAAFGSAASAIFFEKKLKHKKRDGK